MVNVRGYCRTDFLSEKSNLDSQEAQIIDYCNQNGHKLVKIYKDIRDEDEDRVQLLHLLLDIIPGDIIVVADLFYFSHTVLNALQPIREITKRKAKFISINQQLDLDVPLQHFMFVIRLLLNQIKREGIYEEFMQFGDETSPVGQMIRIVQLVFGQMEQNNNIDTMDVVLMALTK